MEHGARGGKDDQWPVAEQDAPAYRIWCGRRRFGARQSARPLVVDRPGRDRQHGERGQGGEDRGKKEWRPLRTEHADCANRSGDEHVAAAVEHGVAAEARRQLIAAAESEGDRRDRRREDAAEDRHHGVRRQHDHYCRDEVDGQPAEGQQAGAADDECPLRVGAVDEGADGGMEHDPRQAADREHGTERCLVPSAGGDQIDAHMRAQASTYIGKQKVEPVESAKPHRRDLVIVAAGLDPSAWVVSS
jgi:hypothetical protein